MVFVYRKIFLILRPKSDDNKEACVCVSRSVVSDSVSPWTVARKAPLSMGFSRQEHWSGLLFPSPANKLMFLFFLALDFRNTTMFNGLETTFAYRVCISQINSARWKQAEDCLEFLRDLDPGILIMFQITQVEAQYLVQ